MNFKNEITLLGVLGENGLPLMVNVEKSFRTGIEIDLIWYIIKNSKGNIRYINNSSYSYNRIKDENRTFVPLYTPNIIINQGIWFENDKIEAGFENKIQSGVYIDWENNYMSPGFYVINIQAGWKFYKNCSIILRLNNITDQEYFTNGYAIDGDKYYFVNPPFNWFITLKLVF